MKQVTLKQVKQGEYFRLNPTETAPVWVRGYYERRLKKYEAYRFDDVNHENFFCGGRYVWIDFEF